MIFHCILLVLSLSGVKGQQDLNEADIYPQNDRARELETESELYQCNSDTQINGKALGLEKMNACFCGLLKDSRNPLDTMGAASVTTAAASVCSGGDAGGYPCSNVDLQSHLPLATFGSGAGNDIWGWTDSGSGREFALIGLSDGTGMVEITDPVNPIYLGKLPTHTVSSSWRDIKVYNDHAYVVSEASGHGMQVFDLSQLLSVASPPVIFSATAHYAGGSGVSVGKAHNLVINEDTGFAYIVGGSNGCSGGLHMVDITSPAAPVYAGCYGGDGYTHDAHCVVYNGPDTSYTGNEICFCANEDTVTIVDVTNKASPLQLSRTPYANDGYTHQGWLSNDHSYFIFGDETDETGFGFNTKTLVMDVQTLGSPSLAGSYFGPSRAIDHNLYTKDGFVYLASYRAGLRVLRIDDLSTAGFTEVGYFDIYPASDSANFNGAWSVFPYFPSGNVVVSGIEQGLYVLQFNYVPPTPAPTPACNQDGVCDPGEDCNSCPTDCGSRTSGDPKRQYCCDGDLPDCGNSNCVCFSPPTEPTPTPPSPTPPTGGCVGKNGSCSSNSDCCSGNCKGGSCKGGGRRLGQQSFSDTVVNGSMM